jgi:hypothetical protein
LAELPAESEQGHANRDADLNGGQKEPTALVILLDRPLGAALNEAGKRGADSASNGC